MTILTLTLTAFLTQLPIILVLLIGFILSLVYWRRHPKVSLLTAIATVGILASLLTRTFLNTWLPMTLYQQGWNTSQVRIVLTTSGVIFSLLSAVFWGLLLTAIFGWRGRPGETSGNRPGETSGNDTSSLINFRNKVLGLESEMMSKLGLAIHATWVLILVSIGIVIPFLCMVAFVWGGGLESMTFLQMFIPGVVISGIFAGPPVVFYALSFWQRFKGRKSG